MVCANAAFGHFNLDNALPKRSFDVSQLREKEIERKRDGEREGERERMSISQDFSRQVMLLRDMNLLSLSVTISV